MSKDSIYRCPHCGATLDQKVYACPKCGNLIEKSELEEIGDKKEEVEGSDIKIDHLEKVDGSKFIGDQSVNIVCGNKSVKNEGDKTSFGDHIEGDKNIGDRVKEKVGTKMQDSVAVRSDIGGDGNAEMKDSLAMRSDIGEEGDTRSDENNSQKAEDGQRSISHELPKLPSNYSVFTGEKVDGVVKYCPECGSVVEKGWKCCVRCGFEIGYIRKLYEK